jgi:hypothetical protein
MPTKQRPSGQTAAFSCDSFEQDPGTKHLYGVVVPSLARTFLQAHEYVQSMPQCCVETAHLASIMRDTENNRLRFVPRNATIVNVSLIGLKNLADPGT